MKIAFTLAEVLITLGIIGIVAAMTIPTLIKNYEKKVTITRLKEVYSTLSNAMGLAKAEYGDTQYWINAKGQTTESTKLATINFCETYVVPYLSGAKIYGYTTLQKANLDTYVALNGDTITYGLLSSSYVAYIIELKNSQILYFIYDNNSTGTLINVIVFTDINGNKKGPNMFGKDTFLFAYKLEKGTFNAYGSGSYSNSALKTYCTKNAGWYSLLCAARIISEGWEINYW